MKAYFSPPILLLVFSCSNGTHNSHDNNRRHYPENISKEVVHVAPKQEKVKLSEWKKEKFTELKNGRFKVYDLEKQCKGETAGDEFNFNHWKLEEKQLTELFFYAEAVDINTWNYQFSVLPCQYEGRLIISDANYKFSINAGSYGIIECSDTIVHLGFYDKKIEGYFVLPPEIGE